MKILLLPLDDRPITSVFPQMIAKIAGIQPVAPDRNLLGSLQRHAQIEALSLWVESQLPVPDLDSVLISIDTMLYGGLISSRRTTDTSAQISPRLQRLGQWKKASGRPVYAQSSIMRISDNYDASEEKNYWSRYGRELFSWSQMLHQLANGEDLDRQLITSVEQKIPGEIRNDYQQTRWRNFKVNQNLLELVSSSSIDVLHYTQDDSGEFGLNVLEKDRLAARAHELGLQDRVLIYAGADEGICALLSRRLVENSGSSPSALVQFSCPETEHCDSRYEGQVIGKTIKDQLKACAVKESQDPTHGADFILLVHGSTRQGDHILLPGQPDLRHIETRASVEQTIAHLESSDKPVVLCDVAYANGSDPQLMDVLIGRPDLIAKIRGYAGWNTTGNTAGSAIAMGVASWFARGHGGANHSATALAQSLFLRFADDWAYQSKVRESLNMPVDLQTLASCLQPYLQRIEQALDYRPEHLSISLPWNRTFEIELSLG